MNATKLLKLLRLSLGGAVLGVAAAGLVGRYFGLDDKTLTDAVGAVAGGTGSALLLKLTHIA